MSVVAPKPVVSAWNAGFYEGARRGELAAQRCRHCGQLIYYPRICCPLCLAPDLSWEALSGLGTIYSFSVVWHAQNAAFKNQLPIVLVIIDLQEGLQMASSLVDCAPSDVRIGSPVSVVCEPLDEVVALPRFRLMQPEGVVDDRGGGSSDRRGAAAKGEKEG